MVSKKLFSAVLATLVILSIVAGSSVAFAQNATTGNATKNVTAKVNKTAIVSAVASNKTAIVSAVASKAAGFLGLPGFEALYAVAGLLVVAFLVIRRRK